MASIAHIALLTSSQTISPRRPLEPLLNTAAKVELTTNLKVLYQGHSSQAAPRPKTRKRGLPLLRP